MDDELEFNGAISNGDMVLFVLEGGDFDGGVLLGISNVGYHIRSMYRTQIVKTRVEAEDREILVESLRGLTRWETRKLSRSMGIQEWWYEKTDVLKMDMLGKTIAKIESDSEFPSLTRRTNDGVPMIIPHRRVLKVADMNSWDEDMTLAPLDWQGGLVEEKVEAADGAS